LFVEEEEEATLQRGTVADGSETPDLAFFADKEASKGGGIFSDPAATPTRDGAQ
jgi:hypothetical protein